MKKQKKKNIKHNKRNGGNSEENKLFITPAIKYALGNKTFKKNMQGALTRFSSADDGKAETYINENSMFRESVINHFVESERVIDNRIGVYPTNCGEIVIIKYLEDDGKSLYKDKDIFYKVVIDFLENIFIIEDFEDTGEEEELEEPEEQNETTEAVI